MSFSSIPSEITQLIVNDTVPQLEYADHTQFTKTKIKSFGREVVNLSLVNTTFNKYCQCPLEKIKLLLQDKLIATYHASHCANSQLLDAVTSGCKLSSLQRHCFGSYNEEIESDIKEIVLLMPATLNYNHGQIRCRTNISPLSMACFNQHIPLAIIEVLLDKGANPQATHMLNNYQPLTALQDLNSAGLSEERQTAIKELFAKYSANTN